MGIATFRRPISAQTRSVPPRYLMLIAVIHDGGSTQVLSVEEDGLITRLPVNEVVTDWRYDSVAGGWEDLNPQEDDDAAGAD